MGAGNESERNMMRCIIKKLLEIDEETACQIIDTRIPFGQAKMIHDGAVTQPPVNTLVALYSYLYSCRHQPTTTRQIPTVDEGERS